MPTITGQLKKLSSTLSSPIEYSLPLGEQMLPLNALLGQKISLSFLKEISCIQCHRKTQKSFQQGYCYPCYRKLLDCNLCIIHPEKCNYPHQDCPDTWEHEHCKQEHIVYLANSSGLKIGITRSSQIPTRWIDQGACQAIALFKVNNRYSSGLIEVFFKQFIKDKTNWRKMLQVENEQFDMDVEKNNLLTETKQQFEAFNPQVDIELVEASSVKLTYPILNVPPKLTTLTFDKALEISGELIGIKGQYLIFDQGVLNIRKHSGYHISVSY